ncbi:MAG TPA: 30S ribosomal protein S12 methylthiotransferase RimO [Deltaproteobacteria bacterium]|nr:30S ribosomal protein S12 methylthiotransferase RimO [Deltaproteobacteria bacterium]HOM28086.1 30S ribosomal protein S12 methylthiotransferase RimO [Deltaproteobacteria bacterium]HPP80529.1 30S ribosomal protein S12 methylthiotransferase RimO [Deltaproteobacteria bacterium]
MKRFSMVSLGCPKNLVDSEYICERFVQAGYTLVPGAEDADLVVINTCAFLTSAVEESITALLEAVDSGREVICAGCLVSRYGRELLHEMPEIVLFAGPGTYEGIVEAYEQGAGILEPVFEGVVKRAFTSNPHSAYVKVSEGCSNRCGYCLIPSIRGPLVSKPPEEVLEECRILAGQGVVEVILVAQDLGNYGTDLGMTDGLARLLDMVSTVEGLEWIRLMYVHPASLSGAVVEHLGKNPKVCPYIDMPIQHVSDRVLEAMGRKGGAHAVRRAFDLLGSASPEVWVRTSLMVGHPGEDDEAFEELERFVASGRVHHLGVFVYSPEEGTRSASLRGRPARAVAARRRRRIMGIQQEVSKKRLKNMVGGEIPVLVEGPHPETDLLASGRAAFQAPEVDGMVVITEGDARPGTIVAVQVTRAWEYDLVGRIVRVVTG